jgi:iron(III) transport system permease protein
MKTTEPTAGKSPFRWSPGLFLNRFGLLIFLLVVLGPLLVLIAGLIPSLMHGNISWLSLAVPLGRRLTLLLNSLGFAAAVAASGVVLGSLGGIVLWRWETGWRSYLRWLVLVLAPIPPYIHALAWTSSINSVNTMLQAVGFPAFPVQGWAMAWWIQLMSLAPVAVGLALVGLKSVDPIMIDAARILRSDISAVLKIVFPLASPALAAGGGVLFLLSLLDYSVPSLVNLNVYSLEVFAEYSASNEPVRAFLLALPLLIISVVIVLVSFSALRNAAQNSSWRIPGWKTAPVLPKWLSLLQLFAVAALALQIAVPIVSLISSAGTWNSLVSTISSAHSEILYSLWIDILVSLLCIIIALPAAGELVNSKKREKLLWILVAAPLAVPPALIGIGLITIWNRPFFLDIYGSSLMPVLAGMARFAPLAVIVLVAQFRRIDPLLIDAARILQANPWQTWRHIWLPMLAPGLLAAAGIVFALTSGELGATLLVAAPGHTTLTIRIYNFLHYGASGTVAGLCLMMIATILAAGVIAALALIRWSNPRLKKVRGENDNSQ